MLVAHRDGEATLVVPTLEAPRVVEQPGVFAIRRWDETDDPVAIVAELAGAASTAAIGDTTWARFLLALQREMPSTSFSRAVEVTGALRAQKDAAEIDALRRAGAAADRVATALQSGEIALVGRTEAAVSAEISARLLAEGHHQVNFAIVAAGENAASPHHDASDRIIRSGEVVLCDFGGTLDGYCSDITRCVSLGRAVVRGPRCVRRALRSTGCCGQGRGRGHAVRGRRRRGTVDHRRRRLRPAVHPPHRATASASKPTRIRTSSRATSSRLAPGHAFSIEPGIYVAGPLRSAARGHRGRDRRGARRDEPRRSRARRRRRLTGTSEGRRGGVG